MARDAMRQRVATWDCRCGQWSLSWLLCGHNDQHAWKINKQHQERMSAFQRSKPSVSTPAYFVILQQSQGKTDEGILVANRDTSSVAPVMSVGNDKYQSKSFLSAECTSGKITVTLDNNNMWNEFFRCNTEMVLTKQGRRMFPYCRYWISGLDPNLKYILVMDITPMDNHRFKWNGKTWEPGGRSEPHVLGRVFIHPESPSTGHYWMHQPISFYKLKLTNNILDQEGHIILHSMHRYLPRLHVVPANKATEVIQLNGPDVHTFTFPQTEFIAVTAYQNFQITQLKIDCNPFAKGFREGAVTGRPVKEAKSKTVAQEIDSPAHKKQVDHGSPESIQKLRELFRASENLDNENEAFIAECEFLNFTNPPSDFVVSTQKKTKTDDKSLDEPSHLASPEDLKPLSNAVIKEEPVDDYDYNCSMIPPGERKIKQESSDNEVTDEYSNSDDDYPILERQFAQFQSEPHVERKRSFTSPSGVAKAKLLKLDSGKMPVVYLEQCTGEKNTVSDLNLLVLRQETFLDSHVYNLQSFTEVSHDLTSSNSILATGKEMSNKDKQRSSRHSVNSEYIMPEDSLSSSQMSCAAKNKLLPIATKLQNTRIQNTRLPSVKSKRGRPRKHKAKTGQNARKTSIATPLFQDFNPDLEDVDGVLFVAFASKDALDVHTGNKPKKDAQSSFPVSTMSKSEKDDQRKISSLQRKLVADLRSMRHRQVIHPALQQVGLKLNIVDHTMSIDLRYLGVQLPLPSIPNNSRWDNYGICAQVSGFTFVSRTGKTTDYRKIKGWREKFSANSSSIKNEGNGSESSLKNRSAFCSDELDEYLENEARLMESSCGFSQKESESDVTYQLPTRSISYVRTLDSVLKKTVSQPPSSSLKPLSTKKRKYSKRKTYNLKANSRLKTISTSNVVAKENSINDKLPSGSDQTVHVLPTTSSSLEQMSLSSSHQQTSVKTPKKNKVRLKLLNTEKNAISESTSVRKGRTAQTSKKCIHKQNCKRTSECNNEFCRLGCVCQSLSCSTQISTHCRQSECMFGCTCLKSKRFVGKCGSKYSMNISIDSSDGEDSLSHPESQKSKNDESNESPGLCSPKSFPIWNKTDIDSDPEPVPARTKVESDDSNARSSSPEPQQPEKMKLPYVDDSDESADEMDNECSCSESLTCARLRIYERKPPQPDNCTCEDCRESEQDYGHKLFKNKAKDKSYKDEENKRSSNTGPTKLIEIISDCSWEQDRSKILNIVSQHMNNTEPQSFKVGSFNIELTSEEKTEDKSDDKTEDKLRTAYSSRVKISMAPDQRTEQCSSKHQSLKWKTESVKLQEHKPLDSCSEKEPMEKSHGGKGLPFYTKIIPAGKLIAHRKTSTVNHSELIQVNGKYYPQAKLLLGQMGALHPANRLAAYITHRLRPSLYNLSKLNELNSKLHSSSLSPSSGSMDENGKDSPSSIQKVDNSPLNKIATQPQPSSVFTQFVMNEVGTLKQKNPLTTLSPTQLLVVTSLPPSKSITSTISSTKMPTLTSHLLTSSPITLDTVSPSQAKTSVPTLIKIISKDSASSPPDLLAARSTDPTSTLTITKVSPTKGSVFPPPPLLKPLPSSTVNASSLPPLQVKNIASPPANSLRTSANSIKLGSVAPQVGDVLPTLTLRPVSPQSTLITKSTVTSPRMEKRMGPRLLLIPMQSSTPPVKPVTRPPQMPGQKVILQPIRSPGGGTNLFRHPNGQIIQLVPLQQVRSALVQPGNQQIVFRNPGSAMGVRLPLPGRTAAVAAPSITAVSSITSKTGSVLGSVSTSSQVSSEVTTSSNPSFLSQTGTLRFRIAPPTTTSDQQSLSKVTTCSSNGQAENQSNVVPLQTGTFALLKIPATTIPASFPKDISGVSQTNVFSGNKDNMPVESGDTSEERKSDSPSECVVSRTTNENTEKVDGKGVELPASEVAKADKISDLQSVDSSLQSEENILVHGNQSRYKSEGAVDQINDQVEQKDKHQHQEIVEPKSIPDSEYPASKVTLEQNMDSEPGGSVSETSLLQVTLPSSVALSNSALSSTEERNTEKKSVLTELVRDSCTNTNETDIKSPKESHIDSKNKSIVTPNESGTKETLDVRLKDHGVIDCNTSDGQSNEQDVDSDVDDSVDIETVEELSEKINIARLKATAGKTNSSTDKCNAHDVMRGRRKGLKKGSPIFIRDEDEDPTSYHRRTHTANERRRRNEMRDLFEDLKNALGLNNLPKVSKSYILKQAIEEIEGLTYEADTLIRKKTLLSQRQNQLIKKMTNLSGRPKEVIMKKLEYLDAKQKAVEAERKKKQLEEDIALLKASLKCDTHLKNPYPAQKAEETQVHLSSKTKKPLILRKPTITPLESAPSQPDVSLISSMVLSHEEQLIADINQQASAQIQSGVAPVVLQFSGTLQGNDNLEKISVPVTQSTLPDRSFEVSPPIQDSDDLSMMPKIVNVTSLANEASIIDLDTELQKHTALINESSKHNSNSLLTVAAAVNEDKTDQEIMLFNTKSDQEKSVKDAKPDHKAKTPVSVSSPTPALPSGATLSVSEKQNSAQESFKHNLTVEDVNTSKEDFGVINVEEQHFPVINIKKIEKECNLDLAFKKVSSIVDNPELDPSELIDVIGDHEDETLTSLLDEIAFLNQELNNDMDSGSDFPGSETGSRSSTSKLLDVDASPYSFGQFKELARIKEKVSLSHLFLQLEEGEIQDFAQKSEDTGAMTVETDAKKVTVPELAEKSLGIQEENNYALTPGKVSKQESSSSDAWWRPMPKLAPLGLKAATLSADQRVLPSKAMPSLAPVAKRLTSSHVCEEHAKQPSTAVSMSSKIEN
ncbi:MAX gene-associated isoform X1 [Pelobates cultripes]|uniref:MAX gene-associated protein n=1 Tax=Pelobates cultripes TaxID=61616 RepID=A0AAD1WV63_PELCU|nr:MAX gene-associated isoform X1 [Pelobates cultripes]